MGYEERFLFCQYISTEMTPTTTRAHPSAAADAVYRQQLGRQLAVRYQANIDRAAGALLADPLFAPTDPEREQTAQAIARKVLDALSGVNLQ